jgi:anti-sigma factor ChrR (cupin superfamily)
VKPSDQGATLPRLVAQALELGARAAEQSWGRGPNDPHHWEQLRTGVDILHLCGDATSGPSVALLRYQPGARVPRHRHAGFEVIYVLSGAQSDERGTYTAGTLVVNREGDAHDVWSDEGCLVLIIWERPIEFV